jgi:hypothetical protein
MEKIFTGILAPKVAASAAPVASLPTANWLVKLAPKVAVYPDALNEQSMRNAKELKIPSWILKYENIKEDRKHLSYRPSSSRLVVTILRTAVWKNLREVIGAVNIKE